MSGIAGVWNLDGRPLNADVLSGMTTALRHRGPDGEGRRLKGAVGFACQHLWVTPEEIGEVQPIVGRAGIMLVMDGRLDNRDELVHALELSQQSSDAACALAAYERWEEDFAERLTGDFALAVFDAPNQRVLLARDAIGIRPLYYFRSDRLFAFASEIKALFAHPEVPVRPDDEGIADYMLISSRPVDQQEITCFAGISALVPAHIAITTPERTVTRRYWDFDTTGEIRLSSVDEYAEALRERFSEAVRRRLRSAYPVAVSVSGGLDSSSVFCQAERLRRSGSAGCPKLVGVSYVGTERTDADERRYLLEIEREYELEIEQFAAEPLIGVLKGADEQVCATEAPLFDYMWGITRELHQRVAARGARVLLGGHWGDQVLFSSAYLVDLFRRFNWSEIRRHTREYARWFGAAEAQVLSQRFLVSLLRYHLPRPLLPSLKWIRRRVLGVERPRPWFTEAFLTRALRFANRPALIGDRFQSAQAQTMYLEARSKYHVHCVEWHNKTAARHGLDAALPMLDRDLLAFLIAIPGEVQNCNGVPRGLFREAMRGVLPDEVRARTWKADFSYLVNNGVSQDVAAIRMALSPESLSVRLGYLDAHRLAPAVARLSAGSLAGPDCLDSWDLADLFGLEVWLQVFLENDVGRTYRRPRQAQETVG
jgi:asparagine synthase (glutamine-hydrolysing)